MGRNASDRRVKISTEKFEKTNRKDRESIQRQTGVIIIKNICIKLTINNILSAYNLVEILSKTKIYYKNTLMSYF